MESLPEDNYEDVRPGDLIFRPYDAKSIYSAKLLKNTSLYG